MKENSSLSEFISYCLREDTGDGDHSSLACIPEGTRGKARLLIKDKGVLAGVRVAILVFSEADKSLKTEIIINDGADVSPGDVAFFVSGSQQSILRAERLVLNIMQRMSGIATSTRAYTSELKGLGTKILDTRKTSPGMRELEKEAVRIGGGENHRMGLYDMIMLKDNHIDYAGGIKQAIERTRQYLLRTGRSLKTVIEARSLNDVKEIMELGGVDRIMLDNFTVQDTALAVKIIGGRFETESSGGITINNIRAYAECGVNFISVGAITHHIKSLDMSLKAVRE
jgi:nicotinate-nucleotide pyrophosphorylase (carboxylating)